MNPDGYIQSIIASFFYISALNEALGHGNRAARFLYDASSIGKQQGESEALVLKRRAQSNSRRSSRRCGSSVNAADSLRRIAEFSHVTVVNPANITLIRDLSLQVF
jgi:hypothetical protein